MFLFVLTDAILLKLDLQKRTSVLGNPPNEKLFVYKKWPTNQKNIKKSVNEFVLKVGIGELNETRAKKVESLIKIGG